MTQNPKPKGYKKSTRAGGYQSPLGKLFARQQPKVKAKKAMAKLLLTYAEYDSKRIAALLNVWLCEKSE